MSENNGVIVETVAATTTTVWGPIEEIEEEDNKLEESSGPPTPQEGEYSPISKRVKFNVVRTVVRYPSEQSLQESIELRQQAAAQNNNKDNNHAQDNEKKNDSLTNGDRITNILKEIEQQTIKNNGNSHNNNDTTHTNTNRAWYQRAQVVQRYKPRFNPPPPTEEKDEEEEEEEDNDDSYESDESQEIEIETGEGEREGKSTPDTPESEGKSASEIEGEETDEEGYNSVVEEEEESDADDPIKKIVEETLQEEKERRAKIIHVVNEKNKLLKDVSEVKEHLHNEVAKSEHASKAATEAATKLEDDNKKLKDRVDSFFGALCKCGVRIAGMIIAVRLLDMTASSFSRSHHIAPSLLSVLLPFSPHVIVTAGVSISYAFLRRFRPTLKWRWFASVQGAVGALACLCAAIWGGAKGSAYGVALVAGCIVGIISSATNK